MAFIDKTKNEIMLLLNDNIDKFYVYSLNANKIPFYIGKGKNDRIFKHLYEAKNYNNISSYNLNMFKINKLNKTLNNNTLTYSIFSFFDIEKDSFNEEKKLIKLLGRKDLKTGYLTNMTDGGDGVTRLNEQSRNSMIQKLTGRIGPNKNKRFSNSWKENISKSKTGITTWNKGKNMSDDAKLKISKSHIGNKLSQVTKDKIHQNWILKSDDDKNEIISKRVSALGNFKQRDDSKLKSSLSNKKTAEYKTKLYYKIKNYIVENNINTKMFRYGKSIEFMENFYKEIKGEINYGIY